MTAARKLETTVEESERTPLANPIVRWFEGLPEAEKRAYDRLAHAGSLYRGDAEAEARALEDGTHPLLAGRGPDPCSSSA